MESADFMGKLSFVPAVVGFWLGILFLLFLDHVIPHLHLHAENAEGPKCGFQRSTMMVLAVILHNIPEGMAVGVVYAGWLSGSMSISATGVLALSVGIAIQNFPEGAIISMPLTSRGTSRGRAFLYGTASGVIEPVAALFTLLLTRLVSLVLAYLLAFAAGAMIYVVVEELIPDMKVENHSNLATISFMLGFAGMMILDIALG